MNQVGIVPLILLLWFLLKRASVASWQTQIAFDENFRRHHGQTSTGIKLLLVVSVDSQNMNYSLDAMKSYLSTSAKFILNCHSFNEEDCDRIDVITHETGLDSVIIEKSRVKGSRAQFYKNVVVPKRIAGFDYVWLIEGDIIFDTTKFNTGKLLEIIHERNVSVAQPALQSQESTSIVHADKTVCTINMLAPVLTSFAYNLLHTYGLSRINSSTQNAFLPPDHFVCDLMAHYLPESKPCSIIHEVSVISLQQRQGRELGARDDSFWMNISKKLGTLHACYSSEKKAFKPLQRKKSFHQSLRFHVSKEEVDSQSYHPSVRAWRQRTSQLYNLHRSQNLTTVKQLASVWENRTLYEESIDPFVLWSELSKVVDITDNSLLSTSQYFHALQLFLAMKKDNITSKELLFLGLFHDIGKVLLLHGEKMENVVCSTFVIQQPVKDHLCYPNADYVSYGDNRLISSWNHDVYGASKLREYAGEKVAWVIMHHSLSPLLRGELDCRLSEIESQEYMPLLRQLWRYDHLYKNVMQIPSVTNNLMEEVKDVIYSVLPKNISF